MLYLAYTNYFITVLPMEKVMLFSFHLSFAEGILCGRNSDSQADLSCPDLRVAQISAADSCELRCKVARDLCAEDYWRPDYNGFIVDL